MAHPKGEWAEAEIRRDDIKKLLENTKKLAEIYTILLNFNLKSLSNYILLVETSYGEYLWDTLISLGNEFNIKPLGYSGYNLLNKEIL